MKIEIEVSEKNEMCRCPWWAIIDPQGLDTKDSITGPFFSRDEARRELKAYQYNYSKKAMVWCLFGPRTGQYSEKVNF